MILSQAQQLSFSMELVIFMTFCCYVEFRGLNTIATLVNYTYKSFIKLTPGSCFNLCTIQH